MALTSVPKNIWGEAEAARLRVPVSYRPWDRAEADLTPGYHRAAPLADAVEGSPSPAGKDADPEIQRAEAAEIATAGSPEDRMNFRAPLAPMAGDRPSLFDGPEPEDEPRPQERPAAKAPKPELTMGKPKDPAEERAALRAPLERQNAERTLANLSWAAAGRGHPGNMILTGSMAARMVEEQQRIRERDKEDERRALDTAREALQKRLAEIDQELKELYAKRDQIDADLRDIMRRMYKDQSGNIDWARYGRENGIDREEGEDAAAYALRVQRELEQRNRDGQQVQGAELPAYFDKKDEQKTTQDSIDDLQHQRDAVVDQINEKNREIQSSPTQSAALRSQKSELVDRALEMRQQQRTLEQSSPFTTKQESANAAAKIAEKNDMEGEVSTLVQALYAAEKEPDPAEKIRRQKEAYDHASPDARDMAYASDEHIRYALEEDYYKTAQATQSAPTSGVAPLPGHSAG